MTSTFTIRGPTIVHSLCTLLLCWLLMQVVHETGHVAGAWLTNGTVVKVVLHPLAISRTDVSPNPAPVLEIWAGPIGGVLIPLLLWITAMRWIKPLCVWLQFFAGFCLLANGLYIGSGVFDPVGDAADLIQHGAATWQLGLFGTMTIPAGLRLWHGVGPEFGWGPRGKVISWLTAVSTLAVLAIVIVLESLFSSRI